MRTCAEMYVGHMCGVCVCLCRSCVRNRMHVNTCMVYAHVYTVPKACRSHTRTLPHFPVVLFYISLSDPGAGHANKNLWPGSAGPLDLRTPCAHT